MKGAVAATLIAGGVRGGVQKAGAGMARSLAGIQLGQDAGTLTGFTDGGSGKVGPTGRWWSKPTTFQGYRAALSVCVVNGKVLGISVVVPEDAMGLAEWMNQPDEFVQKAEGTWGVTFTRIEGKIFAYEATDDAGAWMSVQRGTSAVFVVLHSAGLPRLQQATPPVVISRRNW